MKFLIILAVFSTGDTDLREMTAKQVRLTDHFNYRAWLFLFLMESTLPSTRNVFQGVEMEMIGGK